MISFSQILRDYHLAKSLNIFLVFLFPVSGEDVKKRKAGKEELKEEGILHTSEIFFHNYRERKLNIVRD